MENLYVSYIVAGIEIFFGILVGLLCFQKYILPQKRMKACIILIGFILAMVLIVPFYYEIITDFYISRLIVSCIMVVLCVFLLNIFVELTVNKIIIFVFFIRTIEDNCKYVIEILYEIIPFYAIHNGNIYYIALNIIIYACAAVFLYAAARKVIYPLFDSCIDAKVWEYLWYIPVFLYIVFRASVKVYHITEEQSSGIQFLMIEIIWIISNIFIYGIIFKMLLKVAEDTQMEQELMVAKMQIDMQKQQYERLKNNIAAMRQARHDFRHILISLREYVDTKNYEGLSAYLKLYIKAADQLYFEQICANYAADSIMNYYLERARQEQIQTNISCDIPEHISFPETELCIILGNLFENAIEACGRMEKREKCYIDINCRIQGQRSLVIIVKNSYEGKAVVENDIFLSSKRNEEGIGIESIKSIVKKYNGIIKIDPGNGVFRVSIWIDWQENGQRILSER